MDTELCVNGRESWYFTLTLSSNVSLISSWAQPSFQDTGNISRETIRARNSEAFLPLFSARILTQCQLLSAHTFGRANHFGMLFPGFKIGKLKQRTCNFTGAKVPRNLWGSSSLPLPPRGRPPLWNEITLTTAPEEAGLRPMGICWTASQAFAATLCR